MPGEWLHLGPRLFAVARRVKTAIKDTTDAIPERASFYQESKG